MPFSTASLIPVLVLVLLHLPATCVASGSHLFISAYLQSGWKKAIQLFNPTSIPLNFDDYALMMGKSTTTITGKIPNYDQFITANEGNAVSESGKWTFVNITIPPGGTYTISYPQAPVVQHADYATSSMRSLTADRWVMLVLYDKGTDTYSDVVDVVGSSMSIGPWDTDVSGETTSSQLLIRNRTVTDRIYPDNDYAGANGYIWRPEEWDVMGDPADWVDDEFEFLGYHYSLEFTCNNHDDCPDNGFCTSTGAKCTTCEKCVFDADGIGGSCPSKCPSQCGGAIPQSTCPFCGVSLQSFPSPEQPIIEVLSPTDAQVVWCGVDYSSANVAATVTVSLTAFSDEAATDILYTSKIEKSLLSLSAKVETDCAFQYSIPLTVEPYSTISASAQISSECVSPQSEQTPIVTTHEDVPTWFSTRNPLTRVTILPAVVGSTSSIAVVQIPKPLLNCKSCSILKYNVTMSIDSGPYLLIAQQVQSVALIRDLESNKQYRFKSYALTSQGWSLSSDATPPFSVEAEAPDAPAFIEFKQNRMSPFAKVDVRVVPGAINGAPVLSYYLHYALHSSDDFSVIESSTPSFQLNDSNLAPDSTYNFYATVSNIAGLSQYSPYYTYSTDAIRESRLECTSTLNRIYLKLSVGEEDDADIVDYTYKYQEVGTEVNQTISGPAPVDVLNDLEQDTLYSIVAIVTNARGFVQTAMCKSQTEEFEETRLTTRKGQNGLTYEQIIVNFEVGDESVPITTYDLYYSATPFDPSYADVLAATPKITSGNAEFTLKDLIPETEYTFWGTATNAAGLIQSTSVTYKHSTDPLKESRLILRKGPDTPYESIEAEFVVGETFFTITTYTLYFEETGLLSTIDGSSDLSAIPRVEGTDSKVTLRNLKPDTEYSFFATTVNSQGLEQSTSIKYSFVTDPLSDSTLSIEKGEEGLSYSSVAIEIQAGETFHEITQYVLFYSNEEFSLDTDMATVRSLVSSASSMTLRDLAHSTEYFFYAEATNSQNLVQKTEVFRFETDEPRACQSIDFVVDKDALDDEFCDAGGDRRVAFLQRNTTLIYGTKEYCEGGIFRTTYLPCEYMVMTSIDGIATMSVSGLGTLYCLAVTAFFFHNRKRSLVKAAQPVFLCTTCFAAACLNAANFFRIDEPTLFKCQAGLWVSHLSFTVLFSTLVAKLWRVYELFGKQQMKRIKVTPRHAFQVMGIFIFMDLAILGTWVVIDPYRPAEVEITELIDQYDSADRDPSDWAYVDQCRSTSTYATYFSTGLLICHVILVGSGVYFAYMCRNISKKLAEKSEIAFTVYLSAMLSFLSYVVVAPDVVPQAIKMVFVSIVTFFGTLGGVSSFLVPKLRQGLDTTLSTDDFKIKKKKDTEMQSFSGVGRSSEGRPSSGVGRGTRDLAGISAARSATETSMETVVAPAPGTTRNFTASIWAERSINENRESTFSAENPMRNSGGGRQTGRRESAVRFAEGTRPPANRGEANTNAI